MRKLFIVGLSLIAAAAASAVDFGRGGIGTTGSDLLILDTSARGTALGGAMTAVADDATALSWNPAGLSKVPRISASFMHAPYVADITYENMAFAQRVNNSSVFGAGIRYLNGGSIDRTDVSGNSIGTFSPRSFVGEVGWGQSIFDLSDAEMEVAMGVDGKMIKTDLGAAKATGYAADFGVQSRVYANGFNYDIGLLVENFGIGPKFDQVRDTLPMRIKVGGAVRPWRPLLLTGDLVTPVNDAPYVAAGAEYAVEVQRGLKAAARAGFNSMTYQSLGVASTLSIGLGLTGGDFTFDYAFSPSGAIGSGVHRMSLSFNLPAKVSRRYRER